MVGALTTWSNYRDFQDNTSKEYVKFEIYNVTRDPKYWITYLEQLKRDLQKLNLHIYNREVIIYILYSLLEAYENIVNNIGEELDDNVNPKTIKIIRDEFLEKYNQIKIQYNIKNSRNDEKEFYIKPNTRISAQLARYMGTYQKDFCM